MRLPPYSSQNAIIKRTTSNKSWRECGEKETLLHFWWACKLMQPLWRTVWSFLRKLIRYNYIYLHNLCEFFDLKPIHFVYLIFKLSRVLGQAFSEQCKTKPKRVNKNSRTQASQGQRLYGLHNHC